MGPCNTVLAMSSLGLNVTPRRIVKQDIASTSSIDAAAITNVGTPVNQILFILFK